MATLLLESQQRDETDLLAQIDPTRLPRHIAVIMDGNGRWAKRRLLPRIAGHRAGANSARQVIETCARMGIEALTLYAFSLENWRRPQPEVDFLMRLLREYLKQELPEIHRNNIRMLVIGRVDQLPEEVRNDVRDAMELTAGNTGMKLAVALNYGGRAELSTPATPSSNPPAKMAARTLQSMSKQFPTISTPRVCPIPTCSSAPAAKCALAFFCSGKSLTPKFTSPKLCGPIFPESVCSKRS